MESQLMYGNFDFLGAKKIKDHMDDYSTIFKAKIKSFYDNENSKSFNTQIYNIENEINAIKGITRTQISYNICDNKIVQGNRELLLRQMGDLVLDNKIQTLIFEIQEMEDYPVNWDSYNALPFSKKVINNAISIVKYISQCEILESLNLNVFPMSNNGISIQMILSNEVEADVEVYEDLIKIFYQKSSITSLTRIKITDTDFCREVYEIVYGLYK